MNLARLFFVSCTFLFGCWWSGAAVAVDQDLTPAERYVKRQAAHGKVADLKEEFKNQEDRHLSASFLEKLLTGAGQYPVHRKGVKISEAIISEPLDLELAQIPWNINMSFCTFKKPVRLRDTIFAKHLLLNGSIFEDKVDCHRLQVKLNFFCKGAFFEKGDFAFADIGGQLIADGATFLHEEKTSFNGLKVGGMASFDDTNFLSPVNFGGADISGQFSADRALFFNDSGLADFEGMRVGKTAFFRDVIFHGNVDLSYGSYQHLIIARDDKQAWRQSNNETRRNFLDALDKKVCLGKSPVEVTLQGTTIEGKLDLKNLNLSNLSAQNLRVKGPATFETCTVEKSADRTVCEEGVTKPNGGTSPENPTLEKPAEESRPDKSDTEPKAIVDLRNATMFSLKFDRISWPKEKELDLKMDGLTYTSLAVDEEPGKLEKLLALVRRAAFNTQNYLQLEEFCRRAGHKDWADRVYIAMKDREQDQQSSVWGFVYQYAWGRLTGYGRNPEQVLLPVLIILGIGFKIFNPLYLKKEKQEAWRLSLQLWRPSFFPEILREMGRHNFSCARSKTCGMVKLVLLRFLVSLDQFIPAINLKIAENWQPPGFGTWLWMKLQAISGWILVPIGLAAIYSQLK